jgi:hypothetical protein
MNRSRGRYLSLSSVIFALAFILLGWISSHSITYTLVGFIPHDHYEWCIHGSIDVLRLVGGCGLVLAFILALRSFFRHGSSETECSRSSTTLLEDVTVEQLLSGEPKYINLHAAGSWDDLPPDLACSGLNP